MYYKFITFKSESDLKFYKGGRGGRGDGVESKLLTKCQPQTKYVNKELIPLSSAVL